MNTDVIIKHHQLSLRMIGAWPKDNILSVFYFGIVITFFTLVFETWDLIDVHNDLDLVMDNLVATVGVLLGFFKVAVFRLKRRKLIQLVNVILNDWRLESETSLVMRKNCSRFRRVAKFIIFLDNSMNFTYLMKTIASYILDEVADRKFMAPSKFPFDARQSPYYEVINIAIFVTATIHFNVNSLIDGFFVTLVLHANSKVDIVKKEIKNYSKICQTNYQDSKTVIIALKKLYLKHLECIEFSKNIQDVFSHVAFFHISFITLLQVMSGFMFIEGLENGAKLVDLTHYGTLTISFLTFAGYYCICGEYLKYQTEAILDELYHCSWYTFSIKNKKAIKFMLAKAQRPVVVTMGKFTDLSLIFFTTIVKTSFSYLSLVRAVR